MHEWARPPLFCTFLPSLDEPDLLLSTLHDAQAASPPLAEGGDLGAAASELLSALSSAGVLPCGGEGGGGAAGRTRKKQIMISYRWVVS